MPILADDLLIFVECDELTDYVREDLFMPSRDRLADNSFKESLLRALEKTISGCKELKLLRVKRQQARSQSRWKDEKPLEDVLQSLIASSPNLTSLLQMGRRISAPFDTRPSAESEDVAFKGEAFPTYFKFKGVDYGATVKLSRPMNRRIRLIFETDAQNNYFTRSADRGSFDWLWANGRIDTSASFTGPNLRNGVATVMINFPASARVGDEMCFVARIRDPIRSFEVHFKITPLGEAGNSGGGRGNRRKPASEQSGKNRETPLKMKPPRIKCIYRKHWNEHGFDEHTAMKVVSLGPTDDKSEAYEFKINMDNTSLANESKQKHLDQAKHKLLCRQFMYANVLVGLSMLLDDQDKVDNQPPEADDKTEHIVDRVDSVCRALAPFIPSLISLGVVDLESDSHFEGLEDVG